MEHDFVDAVKDGLLQLVIAHDDIRRHGDITEDERVRMYLESPAIRRGAALIVAAVFEYEDTHE